MEFESSQPEIGGRVGGNSKLKTLYSKPPVTIDTKRPVCYKYGPFLQGRGVE
jgi:hypothetical protein